MPTDKLIIPLPSLIRRIGSEQNKQLRVIAKQHHCELKRIRRSRDWQLIGEPEALRELVNSLHQHASNLEFVLNKLEVFIDFHAPPCESLAAQLEYLLRSNSAITLNELMEQTGCSLSEARSARFALDVL
ncbi:ribosome recycling factor family protein [Vibrio sp. Isolate24]|uniref:ribosome recycling factor family protein n=1 Tax=Vibrio sp. Isolate24 TaxID=2908534 RepID=UPI001EFEB704|nr:ribosome recycling factor family protein [Vibrio sp. Isolate24]MCG9678684.1 ribosome recycling factor family protein [Vibrio sp. Isolate24]